MVNNKPLLEIQNTISTTTVSNTIAQYVYSPFMIWSNSLQRHPNWTKVPINTNVCGSLPQLRTTLARASAVCAQKVNCGLKSKKPCSLPPWSTILQGGQVINLMFWSLPCPSKPLFIMTSQPSYKPDPWTNRGRISQDNTLSQSPNMQQKSSLLCQLQHFLTACPMWMSFLGSMGFHVSIQDAADQNMATTKSTGQSPHHQMDRWIATKWPTLNCLLSVTMVQGILPCCTWKHQSANATTQSSCFACLIFSFVSISVSAMHYTCSTDSGF